MIALMTQRGRIKESERELEQRVAVDFEIHDSKVTRWRAYLSWEEALQVAGLEA